MSSDKFGFRYENAPIGSYSTRIVWACCPGMRQWGGYRRDRWSDVGEVRSWRRKGKVTGGTNPEKRCYKKTSEAWMCVKTNKNTTSSPKNKPTFLHNRATFYTEAHVICCNRQPFCHFSTAGKQIPRFEMCELEVRASCRWRGHDQDGHGTRGDATVSPCTPWCTRY